MAENTSNKKIWLASPHMSDEGYEMQYVQEAFDTNWVAPLGPNVNEFEKELSDWGAVIVKFWVHIDKDTQLARFNDRQSNPEKQWKITDEDWRNREKWDQYETAVDEMLQKTSTAYAPWHILESVDKKYARLKALRIVIEEIEKALK